MAIFAQTVCEVVAAADVSTIVISGLTVIVPVAVATPQPPVVETVYGKEPEAVGVPLMVKVPPA